MLNHSSSLTWHPANWDGFRCDFRVYYEAGRGNLNYRQPEWTGYIYPAWTSYAFSWCRLFDFVTASWIWSMIQTVAFLFLAIKLFQKVNNALSYLFILALLKPFMLVIAGGNIISILAVLLLSPYGCIMAGCFKPYLLLGVLLHLILAYSTSYRKLYGDEIFPTNRVDLSSTIDNNYST
jgi:hypothetical protein